MSNNLNPKPDSSQPMLYEIKVEGHLGQQWTDWFGNASITREDNGNTLLTCQVADQAALYGLLKKMRNLGMPLVSVNRVNSGQADVTAVKQQKVLLEEHLMKAIIYTRYGSPDVLQVAEVEKPTAKENQVLIKVQASSINAGDWRMMRANPFFIRLMGNGFLKPKDARLGWDVAGRVEAVGENVKHFRPGDEVFGHTNGAFAEYVLAREDHLALKPANRSFEEVAAVPVAAITALQGLRDTGRIQPGQKVLIQGASGGVGTFAVQLAKLFGAEVTAVCSPRNLQMVRSLGADHVIDYTKEDFTRNGQCYDLIFAVNGYHPLSAYQRALNPQGIYVCAGGTMSQIFQPMLLGSLMSRNGGKKLTSMGVAKVTHEDLAYLGGLLEAGKIAPVIDCSYPLNEIVEAMRYFEEKHAQGKVVITLDQKDKKERM